MPTECIWDSMFSPGLPGMVWCASRVLPVLCGWVVFFSFDPLVCPHHTHRRSERWERDRERDRETETERDLMHSSKTFQALGKTACCLSSRNLRRFSTRKMCAIPTGTRIFLSLKVRAYRPCTLIGCDVEITSSVVEMHRWLEFFHHFHAGPEFLDHHYDSHNSKLNSKVSGIRTDSLVT